LYWSLGAVVIEDEVTFYIPNPNYHKKRYFYNTVKFSSTTIRFCFDVVFSEKKELK